MSSITIRSSSTATTWNNLIKTAYDNAVNALELSDNSNTSSFDRANMRNILQPKIVTLTILKEMFKHFDPYGLDEIRLSLEHVQLIRSLMLLQQ